MICVKVPKATPAPFNSNKCGRFSFEPVSYTQFILGSLSLSCRAGGEPRQLQNLQADSVVPTGFMNLGQAETSALHLPGDVLIFRTSLILAPFSQCHLLFLHSLSED